MQIDALSLHSTSGWPELGTDALAPGLNVFHGPSASGKTTVADLADAHDLRPAVDPRSGAEPPPRRAK